jgi:catalase
MTQWHRDHLVSNMAGSMKPCKRDIKERMIDLCTKIHPDFGQALAKGLDFPVNQPRL